MTDRQRRQREIYRFFHAMRDDLKADKEKRQTLWGGTEKALKKLIDECNLKPEFKDKPLELKPAELAIAVDSLPALATVWVEKLSEEDDWNVGDVLEISRRGS